MRAVISPDRSDAYVLLAEETARGPRERTAPVDMAHGVRSLACRNEMDTAAARGVYEVAPEGAR